ncbi:MAG: GNAT family N-acetyltransferase [Anaerolineae bacterium]|nr:GNAT family N-acetyltransferase [Anaerolineae bacterium]
MIARLVASPAGTQQHIRPFNPHRDLGELATLIELTFGHDLALTGSHMVRDLRQMALWGPLLNVAQRLTRFLSGYVWIEDGHLVGNVSLIPDDEPGVYSLSNLAVLPEYRGRRIAGALVDTAIEGARAAGGRRVMLQVRSDNELAIGMYRRRGFVHYDTLHEVNLRPGRWPLVIGPCDPRIRPVRIRDGRELYRLVRESTPPEVLKRRPVHRRRYRRGLGWHLRGHLQLLLDGRETIEALVDGTGGLLAYGCVTARIWRGPHEFELYVRPEARGAWEEPLMTELFRLSSLVPRFSLRGNISASHKEALDVLEKFGFETLRVLDQMSLDL